MRALKFFRVLYLTLAALRLVCSTPVSAADHDEYWDHRFGLPGIGGSDVAAVYAVLLEGTNVYIAGHFMDIDALQVVNVARWDGVAWSALGGGLGGNVSFVYALAKSGTNLYAGGNFGGSGGVIVNNIARWDGQTWSAMGSGTDSEVFALGVNNGELYAGGGFRIMDGLTVNGVARWNGTSWSGLTNSTPAVAGVNFSVSALAFQGGDLIVGGNFSLAGGVQASRLARWNGTTWTGIGTGLPSTGGSVVRALLVDGNDIYVGGHFSTAGGANTSGIARYTTTNDTWTGFGTGVKGLEAEVRGIGLVGGDLYVGGSFDNTTTTNASNVARWDGIRWHAVGSGVNDAAHALQAGGEDIFVGGVFDEAGGKSSSRFDIFSNPTRLDALAVPPMTQLSWRLSAFQYALQASTNLTNVNGWYGVTNTAAIVGTNIVVNDLRDVPQKFYRLYRP